MDERTYEPLRTPFLRRIRIRNYKSIGWCDAELGHLSVLVGRNGAGKSNFLDAIRFVADALQTTLDHALRDRGGIDDVRRRSTGHPRNFAIKLDFGLGDWSSASYGFEIAARKDGAFAVKAERLTVLDKSARVVAHFHRVEGRILGASHETMPPVAEDRLFLVNAAGFPDFRLAYDGLTSMGFYNLNPGVIRELQSPDAGELLHRNGSNLASVIGRLGNQEPETLDRIRAYLATISPGIDRVDRVTLGPRETLQFWQQVVGAEHPWKFYAASMSDGTLRALAALVAVAQLAHARAPVRFVGIEEPEAALHPAATTALMDALREATAQTQIAVTSHSSDFLDGLDTTSDTLLVVVAEGGTTRIGPVDPASLNAIKSHLYSPGALLRLDQLQPDRAHLEKPEQLDLFGEREA